MTAKYREISFFIIFCVLISEADIFGQITVSPWKAISVEKDWARAWVLVEDIDNDGISEILSVKHYSYFPEIDQHYTSSIIAYKLDGSVLWKWGDEKIGRNKIHHDIACQIIDWDLD